MDSRIRHLLRSTAPRDAARLDLGLIRAALIVAVGLALLTGRLPPGVSAFLGPVVLRATFGMSVVFVLILAARLGSDAVGDVSTGLLGLVRLAGTRPWQWVALRQLQMWIGFLSVWIVRLPVLLFLPTLGGLTYRLLLTSELALLLLFFVVSNLSLVISFGAATRRHVAGRIVMVLFVWNALLVLPAAIVGSLSVTWPQYFPPGLVSRLAWISTFSLASQFAAVSSSHSEFAQLWPGAALYLAIGVSFLVWFWGLVRTVGTMTVEERAAPQVEGKRAAPRISRRCWDDALAWQAYVYVGRGTKMVRMKAFGYIALVILTWQAVEYGYQAVPMVALPVLCGGLLMNAINKTGECLTREINDKTIGTLFLTPHDCLDLTAGWRRGAWRLAIPDLVLWGCMTIASGLVNEYGPPIMLCIGMMLVASERFFILSPLMPFTFLGVTTGLGLIFVFMAVASVCIVAAAVVHPWMAPVVLAPLLWGFTVVLKLALPYWMEKKVESVL